MRAAVAVMATFALAAAGADTARAVPPTPPAAGPAPKVFAFVSGLHGAELRRLRQVRERIDVIAPNWYALDVASGRLHGAGGARRLLRSARHARVSVWPVVNARTAGSRAWEPRAARGRIVRALLAASRRHGVNGVTLDMEELRASQRDAFTLLVREAAARLHTAGRPLAVYAPRPGPGSGTAYDWSALAGAADLLLCSGYNEHWSGGRPGPVTTSQGFGEVLDRAMTLAGPDRGVPVLGAFGYRWSRRGRGRLISSVDAHRLLRRAGARARREDGAARFRLRGETVHYETTAGLLRRAAAAQLAGARWLGLFSLGREPRRFWDGITTARDARSDRWERARQMSAAPRDSGP